MENDEETEKLIKKYYEQLSDIEKKAYKIAEQQLKSSFIVESTIGFKEFIEKNKKLM
jgi:hypothetical protein